MVRHFRDRVRYYEIMNEWLPHVGTAAEYAELAKAAIRIIREEQPGARIIPASAAPWSYAQEFIAELMKAGLGPLVDVIAWHPWYQADPGTAEFHAYAQQVRALQARCEAAGFRGEYMASEWTWSAPYPQPLPGSVVWNANTAHMTELTKAKYAAQLSVKHVGLGVISLWNETFQTQLAHWSIGLLRNTFSADPIPPTQPEVIYYVQRTLCTVLDDVTPATVSVRLRNPDARVETWGFVRGDGQRMVVFWTPGRASDAAVPVEVDVVLEGVRTDRVTGIDILNGREQELVVSADGEDSVLKGLLIGDCPIAIRF
jgi:hypothetical protein